MKILVIHEIDLEDLERCVIGVATSVSAANKIIEQYYGEFKEVSFTDIRNDNLEYSKVIELPSLFKVGDTYQCKLVLEWFELNKV